MAKELIEIKLKELFDKLEKIAYNSEFHHYEYKQTNQIIREFVVENEYHFNPKSDIESISFEIDRLKKLRIQHYGKLYRTKLFPKKRWTEKKRLKYARKIEEYVVLNNLTSRNASKIIGITTQTFFRIRKSPINEINQIRLERFFGYL